MSDPSNPPPVGGEKRKISAVTIVIAFVISAACAGVMLVFALGFGHQA